MPCRPDADKSQERCNNAKEYLDRSVKLHVLSSWLVTSALMVSTDVGCGDCDPVRRSLGQYLLRDAGSYDAKVVETLLSRVCVLAVVEL
jgi:hypothetical protein